MNLASKQQSLVHRNPTGSRRTQQLGSGKPSLLGLVETQQGRPSQARFPRPSLAGFGETQPGWVPTRPSRLGSSQPLESSLVKTQGRKERKRKKEGEEEGLGG
ncbi:hypothetical protein SLEP1_g25145 [Rubroshorea leprosula]|uniref:Uncharacterized protein n=1 Tax=Rubroshorea leprosula TaxID=152421 RepID=A0AAV5JI02_9ROSI|nr:hypothetical protein SLEP1_g25145 [Rubroshorea leprosula]